ncbi:MAG: mercury(II) reductase [Candidatus Krumholzibacteriia bacterium]
MSRDWDLVVVGGGSGAFAAAIRASELDARVLIINDGAIGGTCVNIGCVPSKTLIRAAANHHAHTVTRFEGLTSNAGGVDLPTLFSQKDKLVASLRKEKYADILPGLPGVRYFPGRAVLQSPHEVAVNGDVFRANRIILATGARPALPPIPGLAASGAWDSTQALSASHLPDHLLVLGGRYIALELGQMFRRFGSRVTLLQRSRQILPEEDQDVSSALAQYLNSEGVEIRTGTTVQRVRRDGDTFVVEFDGGQGVEKLHGDALLYALGRQANTEGLGLECCGLQVNDRGDLQVDDYLETSVPGIYGAGDVIGDPAFVYAAAYEGALAAENALTGNRTRRDYMAIPWVIFTDPQISGAGLNERQAAQQGVAVDVTVLPLSAVPRAIAARDTRGLIKLLRAGGTDRLVGARILAPEGGEQIMEASLAIRFGLLVSGIARHFHPYLTQSEGMKLAAQSFERDVTKLSCCAH